MKFQRKPDGRIRGEAGGGREHTSRNKGKISAEKQSEREKDGEDIKK